MSNDSNASKTRRTRRAHWIPVVAGFLRKDGRILIGQRPENNTLAGQWEFPGGKIELGESPEEALARELREELGIEAEVGELKLACTHTYGDVGILIQFYEIRFWKGEPKAKHHMMLEWIYPEELRDRAIPEANRKILDRIENALGVQWPKSSSSRKS
ncbi:MAG: 8-oxo-dGTP diphosphatase MutT [Bdellovibrionaceae bacterium]|nr:8-oxo-dGTP diphosphatase MutT [Pseudobdellovibrionaceae bacterium]MBX3034696.1 8-oxo-dGTP diphosphatase MutT [Pseudobdellovibrionaceae bacterium]